MSDQKRKRNSLDAKARRKLSAASSTSSSRDNLVMTKAADSGVEDSSPSVARVQLNGQNHKNSPRSSAETAAIVQSDAVSGVRESNGTTKQGTDGSHTKASSQAPARGSTETASTFTSMKKSQTSTDVKKSSRDHQKPSPGHSNGRNSASTVSASRVAHCGHKNDRSQKHKLSNSTEKVNVQTVSHDRVRRIVQEEGRSARNLIAYNVPAIDEQVLRSSVSSKTGLKSPRKKSLSRTRGDMSPSLKRFDDSSSVKSSGSRPASSTGSCATRKTDVRARYWAFLFDNLKRAVDEIYQTCETDESVDECKEVIMILEQCTKDFRALINQWNVIKKFEHLEESGQRPTALAWEVRKTSPGKLLLNKDANSPSPAQLFSPGINKPTNISDLPNGSWADMVKGAMSVTDLEAQQVNLLKVVDSPLIPTEQPPADAHKPAAIKATEVEIDADDDGWETVRRSRSKTSPLSKASSSSKGSLCSIGNGKFEKPNKNCASEARRSQKGPCTKPVETKKSTIASEKKQFSVGKPQTSSHSYRDMVMKSSHNKPVQQRAPASIVTNKKTPEKRDNSRREPVKAPLPRKLDMDDIGSPATGSTADKIELKVSVFDSQPEPADEEEILAMELEEALSNVLEDDELNKQDAAIESMISMEKGYLLEIEQAEREQMPHDIADDEEEDDPELGNTGGSLDSMNLSASAMDWESLMARYEAEAERRKVLGLSWADIDESECKTPGRGAHMHEKLSSPSRKRSITESKRIHEQKQAKAAELRDKFRHEKTERIKDLTKKVEEVRVLKDELQTRKREYLERKQHDAEEKRQQQLMMIVKKAHEEETKANEIAFINTLSEQNKKMDILTKHQDVQARLMDMQEERQRKIGEKAAKEAAVEERRKAINAERSARLAEMQLKRKRRQEEIELKNIERDKERASALKAKEREHRDRLAQLERQQQANIEELQKKIEQKQSESARRHSEQLQSKREKAFIMNILKHSTEDHSEAPEMEPYETKKICTVCNMIIPSEVHLQSHLRGQQHQSKLREKHDNMSKLDIESFNIEHIRDVPGDFIDPKQISSRERSKSLRKRSKKLRQRMQARGNEYEAGLDLRQEAIESPNKAKLNKLIKDMNKFMQAQEKGPWPQNKTSALERSLGEVVRILDRKLPNDQSAFRVCNGLSSCFKLLNLLCEENIKNQYPKTCSTVCHVIRLACKSSFENSHYLLFSNRVAALIDLLIARLAVMVPELQDSSECAESALGNMADSSATSNVVIVGEQGIAIDPVVTALVHTLSVVFSCLTQSRVNSIKGAVRPGVDAFTNRVNDIVSYVITVGIVDRLPLLYSRVRGCLDKNHDLFSLLQHSISFLTSMTKLSCKMQLDVFKPPHSDSTSLMQTYKDIELAGIMSLLYGMLLHNVPTRGEVSSPPEISSKTLTVTLVALRLINQIAAVDYKLVQGVLGAEGVSLELRHIVSYLIWYCGYHKDNDDLLHEVMLCVGYFVVLNPDNQAVVESGQQPTILRQLCSLPFQYFSNPKLVDILYPCLISCCYMSESNRAIIEQELSCDLLANYIEESILESQQQKLSPPKHLAVPGSSPPDGRMPLALRFPQDLWSDAKTYFATKMSAS